MVLENNNIQSKQIRHDVFGNLRNLTSLNLIENHITYTTDAAIHPPFTNLTSLETLLIFSQHHRLKSYLPQNLLQGLTNLKTFRARTTQLASLHKDMFIYTPQLKTLEVSSNDLYDLAPEMFHPIPRLQSLYASRIGLQSLDFFIEAKLNELQFLQVKKNAFSVISEDILNSVPALVYLEMEGNSFTCDCSNAWFIEWVKSSNQTQVVSAYNFVCNYPPPLKNTTLLKFDIQDCYGDDSFYCYVTTTTIILMFLLGSFTYGFLKWQLVYAYYLLLAVLVDMKKRNKRASYQYDAFVSYNIHDEPWVVRELLPKLEEEQGWKMCLHHRDFQPGKPIIDNITDAIYGSRKTICVISRHYLESEWCSREIQMASFRLFDEKKDVLILVFLEEISSQQMSPYHHMRKLLKRRTYLSWPRAEHHTGLFWEKLRLALETGEDFTADHPILTGVEES
ncbi:toll-like receptor 13 [Aplochiton taeniatus]